MFKVLTTRSFERDAKSLLKKYVSLRSELVELGEVLAENPTLGTSLGHDCYKIRISIKSKGKGKSGGARVITYVVTEKSEVILLAIYDKQVKSDISSKELRILLEDLGE
ncbi:type II toxin-antitoxin system RelE/ParE family toxin [Flectobacillus roseus]|uniref:Type II toxin-antitoxin system RelE/ParE family toxin n=1 Tax=Flectobacillus roseus TaxID=502259 RepID=A0ABT6Y2U1_9BACT|nr:type II toxin-antitoxin system RelE/ParE family toxin [Flectobacillus roseus]MDI9857882.1 type II toxin-antitoxin system RelE/ParE family toxin [Flectobacillus roseus]